MVVGRGLNARIYELIIPSQDRRAWDRECESREEISPFLFYPTPFPTSPIYGVFHLMASRTAAPRKRGGGRGHAYAIFPSLCNTSETSIYRNHYFIV